MNELLKNFHVDELSEIPKRKQLFYFQTKDLEAGRKLLLEQCPDYDSYNQYDINMVTAYTICIETDIPINLDTIHATISPTITDDDTESDIGHTDMFLSFSDIADMLLTLNDIALDEPTRLAIKKKRVYDMISDNEEFSDVDHTADFIKCAMRYMYKASWSDILKTVINHMPETALDRVV